MNILNWTVVYKETMDDAFSALSPRDLSWDERTYINVSRISERYLGNPALN